MVHLQTVGLMEYFKDTLKNATDKLGVAISKETEFYIVDLLFRYADAGALSTLTLETDAETFSELFLKSQTQPSDRRALSLKYIGDTTLFLTGYFPDSFQRAIVDIDYYASLGRASYQNLLDLLEARVIQWRLKEVFNELSKKYVQMMDVLAEVSASDGPQKAVNQLRIFERWLRTGSQRDERLLKEMGIIPTNVSTPKNMQ